MHAPRREDSNDKVFFLPDFCAGRMALAIVLIVELVAVVIALGRQAIHDNFWIDLACASMFLMWIGLGCTTVLCRTRPWLSRMNALYASSWALILVAAVVGIVSEATFQLGVYFSGGVPTMLDIFPQHHSAFVLRNVSIGFIVSSLAFRYFYVSTEWKHSIQLESQARIHALQARIRPHFLFNSMNTIAALTRSNPKVAEEAVQDLADLFRASLSDARQRISLREEIEVARVYERIEQLRLGARLRVAWQVDTLPMDAQVPSLLLQPLLENAIYHGIERLEGGGEVLIDGRFDGTMIVIAVANPVINATNRAGHAGNKLALDNISQRLKLAWPDINRRADVTVQDTTDKFVVTLTFPYTPQLPLNA
ncbi:MAG: histidine kinase [Candidatus Obscuribacterales bacterium]|nr:histidine kinase [Steroidobacteraceae bacterium]